MLARLTAAAIGSAATLLLAGGRPDPLPPEYTVLSTHDNVRVLRFAAGPGGMGAMHTHPPHFALFLRGGTVKFATPDGRTMEATFRTGQTMEITRPLTHAVQVTGADSVALLIVEYGAAPRDSVPRE